jgi:uncharacterized protein (UPF0335 family)
MSKKDKDTAALNTGEAKLGGSNGGPIAADALKKYVERIERIEEEKKELANDIKEIYVEAKSNGFEPKIMRKLISLRKMDKDEREEEEALLEVYKQAIGL